MPENRQDYLWRKISVAAMRSKRRAWAGKMPAPMRRWFMHQGSMTRQLRTLGELKLKVEWFREAGRLKPYKLMWVRHTYLTTQDTCVEAWVWFPWSGRFRQRHWFEAGDQPVGDVLFRRPQKRYFRFFTLPGDTRIFRYSHLQAPHGAFIHLVEAYNQTIQPTLNSI